MHNSVLYNSSKTTCLGKIWFFRFNLKRFQPVRLQDSLISIISERNQLISKIFCMEIFIKGRQHVRLPSLVGSMQVCLWSSWILRFFYHQYLWKESNVTFVWTLSFCLYFLFISLPLLSSLAGAYLFMPIVTHMVIERKRGVGGGLRGMRPSPLLKSLLLHMLWSLNLDQWSAFRQSNLFK